MQPNSHTLHPVLREGCTPTRIHNFIFYLSFLKMLLNVSEKLVNFSSPVWMVGAVWAFFLPWRKKIIFVSFRKK